MGASTNPFRGIKNARPSAGGIYTLTGTHYLEIGECKIVKSAQKTGSPDMLIVEYTTIDSTNPEMLKVPRRSWVVNFSHQPALGNVKAFTMALYNCLEEDVDDDLSASIVDASQPGRGKILKAQGAEILTKEKRQPFTKVIWEYVAENVEQFSQLVESGRVKLLSA